MCGLRGLHNVEVIRSQVNRSQLFKDNCIIDVPKYYISWKL